MKVLLSEATGPQMRAFAVSHLGMEAFPQTLANEKVRAAIAAAWNKEEIEVEDPPAQTKMVGAKPPGGTPVPEDKVKVLIMRTEDAGGDEDVPLGVNGSVMLVPRGRPVDIPKRYFEALENAVKDVYETLPEGGMNPVPRKVPAFPYQRVA